MRAIGFKLSLKTAFCCTDYKRISSAEWSTKIALKKQIADGVVEHMKVMCAKFWLAT